MMYINLFQLPDGCRPQVRFQLFRTAVQQLHRKLEQPDNPVHLPMRRANIVDFMGLTIGLRVAFSRRCGQWTPFVCMARTMSRLWTWGVFALYGVVVAEPAPYTQADPDYYPHKED